MTSRASHCARSRPRRRRASATPSWCSSSTDSWRWRGDKRPADAPAARRRRSHLDQGRVTSAHGRRVDISRHPLNLLAQPIGWYSRSAPIVTGPPCQRHPRLRLHSDEVRVVSDQSSPPSGFTPELAGFVFLPEADGCGGTPRTHAAHMRRCAAHASRGSGKVSVITRSLRYPGGWPSAPAEEKGIDGAQAERCGRRYLAPLASRGGLRLGSRFDRLQRGPLSRGSQAALRGPAPSARSSFASSGHAPPARRRGPHPRGRRQPEPDPRRRRSRAHPSAQEGRRQAATHRRRARGAVRRPASDGGATVGSANVRAPRQSSPAGWRRAFRHSAHDWC